MTTESLLSMALSYTTLFPKIKYFTGATDCSSSLEYRYATTFILERDHTLNNGSLLLSAMLPITPRTLPAAKVAFSLEM